MLSEFAFAFYHCLSGCHSLGMCRGLPQDTRGAGETQAKLKFSK